MKKLSPCLWFDTQAEEAARFYVSLFPKGKLGTISHYSEAASKQSGRPAGSVLTADLEIMGLPITLLNGGPIFKLNASHSLFVYAKDDAEVKRLWKALHEGGSARMELGTYPWSQCYGWLSDRFGVEWQIMVAPENEGIAPCFLFVKNKFGQAQAAMNHYLSILPNSKVVSRMPSEDGKYLVHARLELCGQPIVMMDGPGPHDFEFNDAFSFQVFCHDQAELDTYWEKLKAGGQEIECGWLKDKFGVSWQIVPEEMVEWMKDPAKAERVMNALLKMKKLDVATLKAAAKG